MNSPKGIDDPTPKGVGNPPSSKEQTQPEDPATLAVPDPLKRKVGDPLEPKQSTEAVKEFFGSASAGAEECIHMLEEEGELHGLVGPQEVFRLWSRHAVDAAAVLDFLPHKGQILNIGSGAGLPGIVTAIRRPDFDVHLTGPIRRRYEWLFGVVEDLGLDNVTIHQTHAEGPRDEGRADVIAARAVTSMSKLIRMTARLIAPGDSLMAFKGRRAAIEIEEVAKGLKSRHLRTETHGIPSIMEDGSTCMVVYKRQKQAGLRVRARSEVKPGLTTGSELNAESPRSNLR